MRKYFITTVLLISVLNTLVFAKEVKIKQKDVVEINNYTKKVSLTDIDDLIEDSIQKYSKNNNFEFGIDEKRGKHFIYALETVSLKPMDPDFVKSLSVAYEKAFLSAQEQFVMDTFGKIISEKETELFSDNSTNAKEFESDKVTNKGIMAKIGRVFDKTLSLAEKQLDNALVELGVDDSDIEKLNKSEKKILYKNKFISKSMKEAYGRVSGFIPIKTFVGKDESGQYGVGVIAMRSDKTSQIAKDISMQRETLIEGRGKEIKDIVPSDKKVLLNEFGLRLVFDATGKPALISYAQWGFNATGLDSYMKSQAKKNAKSMAQDMADSMIADFVNGNLQVSSESEHGEIIQRVLEKNGGVDGMVSDKIIKNIIDKTSKNAKLKSSMKLAGVSTVRRWSTTNEHGLYVAGVVRKWTFGGLNAAKSVQSGKRMSKVKKQQDKQNYSRSVNESSEYNTVNDF
ncbi:MAG TPA: hypothetical protein EYG85_10490 [Crocinitomix sp.]|nr:hypothetical protein [Crocinitomix sp.]